MMKASDWISIKDRLPEADTMVLICTDMGGRYQGLEGDTHNEGDSEEGRICSVCIP